MEASAAIFEMMNAWKNNTLQIISCRRIQIDFVCEQKSVLCQANWMNMLKYSNFLLSCKKWVLL